MVAFGLDPNNWHASPASAFPPSFAPISWQNRRRGNRSPIFWLANSANDLAGLRWAQTKQPRNFQECSLPTKTVKITTQIHKETATATQLLMKSDCSLIQNSEHKVLIAA